MERPTQMRGSSAQSARNRPCVGRSSVDSALEKSRLAGRTEQSYLIKVESNHAGPREIAEERKVYRNRQRHTKCRVCQLNCRHSALKVHKCKRLLALCERIGRSDTVNARTKHQVARENARASNASRLSFRKSTQTLPQMSLDRTTRPA